MFKNDKIYQGLVLLSFLSLAIHTQATELKDAREIVTQAEQAAYYAGFDGRSAARMKIVDAQGRKQLRQFTILRKDAENSLEQDMLVYFSRPADIRGTVFRVHKNPALDDDRWLYLPGLDLVKRISASDKRTSFVGSHFFYEDVSGRSTELDDYELLDTTANHYVLKARPKESDSVEFDHYIVEIDIKTMLPTKIDFYKHKTEPYRRVEALKVAEIDGHPTVVHSKVSDLENGGFTEMQFRFIRYDLGLPESLFSERSMRTPPQKWLSTK